MNKTQDIVEKLRDPLMSQQLAERYMLEAACEIERLKEKDMERCKTCKHWEKPVSNYGEVPGTGKCKAVVLFWDATEWSDDGDKRRLKPKYAGRLAFVQDGSDYYAVLRTLPDFGCVQHEGT